MLYCLTWQRQSQECVPWNFFDWNMIWTPIVLIQLMLGADESKPILRCSLGPCHEIQSVPWLGLLQREGPLVSRARGWLPWLVRHEECVCVNRKGRFPCLAAPTRFQVFYNCQTTRNSGMKRLNLSGIPERLSAHHFPPFPPFPTFLNLFLARRLLAFCFFVPQAWRWIINQGNIRAHEDISMRVMVLNWRNTCSKTKYWVPLHHSFSSNLSPPPPFFFFLPLPPCIFSSLLSSVPFHSLSIHLILNVAIEAPAGDKWIRYVDWFGRVALHAPPALLKRPLGRAGVRVRELEGRDEGGRELAKK